ncbi:hypothetical protein [Actinoplanes sp. NPDC049599]|uniref:hypothetical protein n=1 Tax=Actinoplanes sp. NPDC049599 TaxID=3363903 RepID=UPI0037B5337D
MAFRTWAKLLAATLGVGALAGASQLGLVYGLGIVRLTRVLDVTTRDQWTAQLAWVAWMPMLAAVLGALVGAALLRRWSPGSGLSGVGTELALAFSAAIGAGVVVPLTMQPARTAQVDGVNAVVVIAICAGLGALVGVFAAWAALAQVIARWSLLTMGAAVWLIALVSVAPSLAPSDPLPAVRLGVFDAGFLSPAVTQRTALATMPALALLIGAALGWAARRRDLPTLTIALAGLPGPALLTVAYLIAGPGAGADRYQVVPYWAAMTATGAGVLGSVLAAVLRRGPGPDDEDDQQEQAPEKPPLPKRTNQPESAIAAAGAPPAGGPPAADQPGRPGDTGVFDRPQRGRPGGPDSPASDTENGPSHGPGASYASGPGSSSGPGATASGPGASYASGPGSSSGPGTTASGPAAPGASPGAGPGAGLGGPAAMGAKPEKPRRRGRRSSVADAFIGRTGEFPATRPGPGTPDHSAGLSRDADPVPFDAFSRGAQPDAPRSGGAPWSPAADAHHPGPAPEPKPYVPEPATRPLPPGVGTSAAEPPRGAGGRPGRGLRPFGRGKGAEPLTPEPTPISAPLPQPDPVTPPLAVTPAPRSQAAPQPLGEAPHGKRKPKNGKDEDYVDWVSGLGK